jgi:predicted metal-dependent phosphotriesterase family hydrolase
MITGGRTASPLMSHPGRDQTAPMPILELIGRPGVDLRRATVCHVDRTIAGDVGLDPARVSVFA